MWETPEPGTWRLNAEYMEGLLTSASLQIFTTLIPSHSRIFIKIFTCDSLNKAAYRGKKKITLLLLSAPVCNQKLYFKCQNKGQCAPQLCKQEAESESGNVIYGTDKTVIRILEIVLQPKYCKMYLQVLTGLGKKKKKAKYMFEDWRTCHV